jgi:hypothetical protein
VGNKAQQPSAGGRGIVRARLTPAAAQARTGQG